MDRDTLERLVWTVIAAALAQVPIVLADLDQWWVLPVIAAVNWLLIQVRERTPLPSPGEGLPGLPTSGGGTP